MPPERDAHAAPAPAPQLLLGPLDRFLVPQPRQPRQPPCVPQAVLRSPNLCQQLLCAQLGWRPGPAVTSWHEARVRQQLARLTLPRPHEGGQVCCMALQQQHDSSAGDATCLVAVGHVCGLLHVVRLAHLEAAAAAAAKAADADAAACRQAEPTDDGGEPEPAAQPQAACGPEPLPAPAAHVCRASLATADAGDRLSSCCWLPRGAGSSGCAELATAGGRGVKLRRFQQGRCQEVALTLRGGAPLAKAVQVACLPPGAAASLAAAHPGGVVLWDCRASASCVAQLPTAGATQRLLALPGGELLLTAAADGQLSLLDVRRVSSAGSSSVVNFGGSRASQALVAAFNVPARAAEAAAAAPCSAAAPAAPGASGGACAVPYPFFADVALNPRDSHLLAFVRQDLQLGVFDLCRNALVEQAGLVEVLGEPRSAAECVLQRRPGVAGARLAWDAAGRVLYSHGLLQAAPHAGGRVQVAATLAAVDVGGGSSSARWHGASSGMDAAGDGGDSASTLGPGMVRCGSGWLCRRGRVLHMPLHRGLGLTELALVGQRGQLLAGTLAGDLLWLS